MQRRDNAAFSIVLVGVHAHPGPESVPLGIASLAASLKADPVLADRTRVGLVEACLPPHPDPSWIPGLCAQILLASPDLVGLSVFLWNRPAMIELARQLRITRPGLWLVAGGPDAGADPERTAREFGAGTVIAGEGEAGFVHLVRERLALAAVPVPGDCLASPWLDGTLDPGAYEGVLWELTRGCPFTCTFCYESRGQRGVRPLPERRIMAELELFAAKGVRQVFVLDPTFNTDRRRAINFLETLRRRVAQGWDCHFRFEIRAELLDKTQAAAFAGLDCSVQIGLQSAHPAVLAKVGRSLDPADFARKVGLLNQAGAVFGFDLIWGLPGDDLPGFRRSLDWALALQPNHLDVFGLSVLPGTTLAEQAAGFGLVWQADAPYAVLSSPGFPAADLDEARGLAEATDWFYNRGRAVPWFVAVVLSLGLKPSRFLQGFAAGLRIKPLVDGCGHAQIEARQLEWLEACCGLDSGTRPTGLFSLIRDVVRLNGAWSRAFAEGQASTLELSWDPDALESPAAGDLRRFLGQVSPRATVVRITNKQGRVTLERQRKPTKPRGAR